MMTFEARLVGIIFWVLLGVFFAASGIYRKLPPQMGILGYVEQLYQFLEKKLNRPSRGNYVVKLRGALVLLLMIIVVWFASEIAYMILGWFGTRWPRIFLEAALVALLVRPAAIVQAGAEVSRLLVKGNLEGARSELQQVAKADVLQFDATGVGRFTVETMARSLYAEAFAPAFWYFLGGLYFLMPYLVIRMLTREDRVNAPEGKIFLAVPLVLHRALNLFPVLLTAGIASVTSFFVPDVSPVKDFKEITKSPDPEDIITSAYAQMYGLTLGGPRAENGVLIEKPWFGNGTAAASPAIINKAIMHYLVTFVSILLIVGLAALIARS